MLSTIGTNGKSVGGDDEWITPLEIFTHFDLVLYIIPIPYID